MDIHITKRSEKQITHNAPCTSSFLCQWGMRIINYQTIQQSFKGLYENDLILFVTNSLAKLK